MTANIMWQVCNCWRHQGSLSVQWRSVTVVTHIEADSLRAIFVQRWSMHTTLWITGVTCAWARSVRGEVCALARLRTRRNIPLANDNLWPMLGIIKWSGISPYFARLWLAETAFTGVYLRVSWPQMLNDGLFGVSVMSQRKRRFSRQCFAQTDEFRVHFLMTSQYTHLISRRFFLAADNAMDVSLLLKSISRKIPDNLIKQL